MARTGYFSGVPVQNVADLGEAKSLRVQLAFCRLRTYGTLTN
jgi:hypothetical protein